MNAVTRALVSQERAQRLTASEVRANFPRVRVRERRKRAQRLTASEVRASRIWHGTAGQSNGSAQRLTASEVRAIFTQIVIDVSGMCSTPYGIRGKSKARGNKCVNISDVLNALRHQR